MKGDRTDRPINSYKSSLRVALYAISIHVFCNLVWRTIDTVHCQWLTYRIESNRVKSNQMITRKEFVQLYNALRVFQRFWQSRSLTYTSTRSHVAILLLPCCSWVDPKIWVQLPGVPFARFKRNGKTTFQTKRLKRPKRRLETPFETNCWVASILLSYDGCRKIWIKRMNAEGETAKKVGNGKKEKDKKDKDRQRWKLGVNSKPSLDRSGSCIIMINKSKKWPKLTRRRNEIVGRKKKEMVEWSKALHFAERKIINSV